MLKKLFHYFKHKKKTQKLKDNLSITISLQPDYSINIEFNYPDLINCNVENIPNIAEKYAELLIYINSNILKYKILDILNEKAYRSDDTKQKLFFDNVLSFHDIIRQQIKKANNNNSPLISPMSVFTTK